MSEGGRLTSAALGIRVLPSGMVDRIDAAKALGRTAKTLSEWKRQGIGPKSHSIGGREFYVWADVLTFMTPIREGDNAVAIAQPCGGAMTTARKPGRPRGGEEVKSSPLSVRLEPALRAEVGRAASMAGRSITQELECCIRLAYKMEPPVSKDDNLRRLIREELAAVIGASK